MNKLQLYITISLNGFHNQAEINATNDIKQHVCDLSVALEDVDYDPKEKCIFYMLKSTDQGVFIIVLRTIPSNPTDHLASWIFVPSEVEITDQEISEVVDTVVDVVSRPKISSAEFNMLRNVFDKQYECYSDVGATVESIGKTYAHRFYGHNTGYTLIDYIGKHRYQTTYIDYAGVIIADKDIASFIAGPDLTTEPLDTMVLIYPPQVDDCDYRPLIFGRPFDQPFLVPLMGTIEVVWESPSSVDIRRSIMISKPNMRPDCVSIARQAPQQPSPVQSTPSSPGISSISIDKPSTTPITAHASKPVTAPVSTPATAPVSTPVTAPVSTPVTAPVSTPVTAPVSTPATPATPSVAEKEQTATMTQKAEALKAEATKAETPRTYSFDRPHIYNFEIPAKSADISGMIRFEIQTRANLQGSPIDGYELCDTLQEGASRSNHLIYAPSMSILKKVMWGVAGFIAGVALTLLCTRSFGSMSSTSNPLAEQNDSTLVTQGTDSVTVETQTALPAVVTLDEAIKYLDTNDKWEKAQLEAYPDLRGLYDDMIKINRERIVSYWGPKLKDSRKFSRLVEHSQKSLKAHKKPRVGKNGNFDNGSTQTIKYRSYLNAVDP